MARWFFILEERELMVGSRKHALSEFIIIMDGIAKQAHILLFKIIVVVIIIIPLSYLKLSSIL